MEGTRGHTGRGGTEEGADKGWLAGTCVVISYMHQEDSMKSLRKLWRKKGVNKKVCCQFTSHEAAKTRWGKVVKIRNVAREKSATCCPTDQCL